MKEGEIKKLIKVTEQYKKEGVQLENYLYSGWLAQRRSEQKHVTWR